MLAINVQIPSLMVTPDPRPVRANFHPLASSCHVAM